MLTLIAKEQKYHKKYNVDGLNMTNTHYNHILLEL